MATKFHCSMQKKKESLYEARKSNKEKALLELSDYFGITPDGNTIHTSTLSSDDEIEIGNICDKYGVDFALGTSHVTVFGKGESKKSNESVSTTDARKFVDAHSNGILATLAEICAMAADAAIEDVNGLSAPDLEVIKDDAQFAYKEYEQPLKDLAIRLANKFATAKVEGWNDTTLMNGNL